MKITYVMIIALKGGKMCIISQKIELYVSSIHATEFNSYSHIFAMFCHVHNFGTKRARNLKFTMNDLILIKNRGIYGFTHRNQ